MLAKRAYLVKEKQFELRTEEISVREDEILVKIKLCGLCNWELNHWNGAGAYYRDYPKVIGHEWVGVVAETGEGVTGFQIGDRLTVLPGATFEGFAEYCAVKACDCYKLNENVSFDNGMGEPIKCILTVLRASQPMAGDYGVVLGCGPMGLWCVQALCGNSLAGLIAIDIDDAKLALAGKYGASHCINPAREDAAERLREITNGRMTDFVIEGTGIAKILNEGIYYLRNAGRLVLMSSHEKPCDKFDFRPAIERGIDIKMAHPNSSPDVRSDMSRAVALINNSVFSNESIITHRFKLDEINKAFEALENKPKDYIKGIVEMD